MSLLHRMLYLLLTDRTNPLKEIFQNELYQKSMFYLLAIALLIVVFPVTQAQASDMQDTTTFCRRLGKWYYCRNHYYCLSWVNQKLF